MHSGVISIDDASGTPVDISNFVQDFEIPEETRPSDPFHTLGGLYADGVRGGIAYTATLTFLKTTGAAEPYKILSANMKSLTQRTITITADTPDSAAGSERSTGEWILVSLSPKTKRTSNSGAPEVVTAKFNSSGNIAFSTL